MIFIGIQNTDRNIKKIRRQISLTSINSYYLNQRTVIIILIVIITMLYINLRMQRIFFKQHYKKGIFNS